LTYGRDVADPTMPVRRLMYANATVRFVLVYELTTGMIAQAVTEITQALQAGALIPLPEHHFALRVLAAAHKAVETWCRLESARRRPVTHAFVADRRPAPSMRHGSTFVRDRNARRLGCARPAAARL